MRREQDGPEAAGVGGVTHIRLCGLGSGAGGDGVPPGLIVLEGLLQLLVELLARERFGEVGTVFFADVLYG